MNEFTEIKNNKRKQTDTQSLVCDRCDENKSDQDKMKLCRSCGFNICDLCTYNLSSMISDHCIECVFDCGSCKDPVGFNNSTCCVRCFNRIHNDDICTLKCNCGKIYCGSCAGYVYWRCVKCKLSITCEKCITDKKCPGCSKINPFENLMKK